MLLQGIIEADETYIGAKSRKHGKYKNTEPSKRGRGTKKTPVLGAIQRGGKEKDALHLKHETDTGTKSGKHTYYFRSSGWYILRENIFGGEATDLFVEFDVFIIDDQNLSSPIIGLNAQGRNYIKGWARLRVYVSR